MLIFLKIALYLLILILNLSIYKKITMNKDNEKRFLFKDILRDKNSKKYSFTKFASLIILISLIGIVITGIKIMIQNNEIDNLFVGAIIGLLITLLGYKNLKNQDGNGTHDN